MNSSGLRRGQAASVIACPGKPISLARWTFRTGLPHFKRYWISVDLDADVPADDIEALAGHSWDQIAATLTRKKQEELATLRG